MNHHDVFFKQLMAWPEALLEFLRLFVPAEILAQLDLSRLRWHSGAFADVRGREHFSKLVVFVPTHSGEELGIFVLVEHKSEPERRSPFQLRGYMSHLWDRAVQAGEVPHAILPIVVYHGQRAWPSPERFEDNVSMLSGMSTYTPSFRYVLVDLARLDVAKLTQPGLLQSGLLALKHIYEDALGGQLAAMYRGIAASGGVTFVEELTRYLTRAGRGLSKDALTGAASQTLPPEGAMAVTTIAEQIYAEGLIAATLDFVRSGLITKPQADQKIDALVQSGQISEADAEKAKQQIAEA